jgi:hypothetical protein
LFYDTGLQNCGFGEYGGGGGTKKFGGFGESKLIPALWARRKPFLAAATAAAGNKFFRRSRWREVTAML